MRGVYSVSIIIHVYMNMDLVSSTFWLHHRSFGVQQFIKKLRCFFHNIFLWHHHAGERQIFIHSKFINDFPVFAIL